MQTYKYTCDKCGKTEEKETSGIPKAWENISIKTSSYYSPSARFYKDYLVCRGCAAAVGIPEKAVQLTEPQTRTTADRLYDIVAEMLGEEASNHN